MTQVCQLESELVPVIPNSAQQESPSELSELYRAPFASGCEAWTMLAQVPRSGALPTRVSVPPTPSPVPYSQLKAAAPHGFGSGGPAGAHVYEALNPSAVTEPSEVRRTSIADPLAVAPSHDVPWQTASDGPVSSAPSYMRTKSQPASVWKDVNVTDGAMPASHSRIHRHS